MSQRLLEIHRLKKTSNIGAWLSSKIYSDVKSCNCGGKFTAHKVEDSIRLPICDKCSDFPPLFRIKAHIIDEANKVKYLDVRYNVDQEKITKWYHCMTLLTQVEKEIKLGIFDVNKYASKKSRDSFLFENVAQMYLDDADIKYANKKLRYYGHKNLVKYTKVLLKHFTGWDIALIDEQAIEGFRDSFTEKFTNRDSGTRQLRSLLNFALKKKKLRSVPVFDPIPTSAPRENQIHIDVARSYIPSVPEKQYRLMLFLQTVYAWRPCETRALKKKDIDILAEKVTISSHFSGPDYELGRKSIGTGKNASLEFDLVQDLKDWITEECMWIGTEDFIFQQIPSACRTFHKPRNSKPFFPSKGGLPLSEKTLADYWKKHLKKIEVPHVVMYEFRGARGTEIAELSNGNALAARDFLGHNNVKTTEKHYIKNKNISGNFIQKDAKILELKKAN